MSNVFGDDDREAMTSREYPWNTIGYLSPVGCTATLVGKDLIVTAAHCIIVPGTNQLVSGLEFHPNMIAFEAETKSAVTFARFGVSPSPNGNVGAGDWAVARLADKLGDRYGWMGSSGTFTGSYVTLAGYSGDFRSGGTAGVHRGCTIRGYGYGYWRHDCDATRGASGGPLFYMNGSQPTIVAVQSGENREGGSRSLHVTGYSDYHSNTAIPASEFVSAINLMKQ